MPMDESDMVPDSPLDSGHDRFLDEDAFARSMLSMSDSVAGHGSTITALPFNPDMTRSSAALPMDSLNKPGPANMSIQSEPVNLTEHPPVKQEEKRIYPDRLQPEGPAPHLVVTNCDTRGVTFAFDSSWLKHDGFRSSLPLRCVVSGDDGIDRLIARPVLFTDQYHGGRLAVDEVHSQYENRVLAQRTPRQITRQMGLIEKMPNPFHYAMPYYVHTRHANHVLHCGTHDRQDGGITCEVVIPCLAVALEWLARVNGVCGSDYAMLEEDISLMHGESWRQLSETCRQRINAWCKLDSEESFRLYLTDADFGKRDQGMAGLVITDKRVVLCKYHHRGQVARSNRDAAVHIRCDGNFAALRLVIGDNRSKTLKLHRNDLKSLLAELRQSEGLRVLLDENHRH